MNSTKRSEETRQKISQARTGTHHSEETKEKISESVKKHIYGKDYDNFKTDELERSSLIFDVDYWKQFDINVDAFEEYINFILDIISLGNRELDYSERHHILPKKVDPTFRSNKYNIVRLTAREHYIAHEKLVDVFNGKFKRSMVYAIHRMSYDSSTTKYIPNAEEYERLKLRFSETISNVMSNPRSEKWKKSMSETMSGEGNPFYGKHHTDESKKKISESNKGKVAWNTGIKMSDEFRSAISKSHKGIKMPNRSRNSASPGTIWITNGETSKRIDPSDFNSYELLGWRRGKRYHEENPIVRTRSEEACEKSRQSMKNRKFMNNGIENVFIKIEEIPNYEKLGYKLGKIVRKKSVKHYT